MYTELLDTEVDSEEYTVDTLVEGWIKANLLVRVSVVKTMMKTPPTSEAVVVAKNLMVEIKLLNDLISQVKDGVLNLGAAESGLTEIPISNRKLRQLDIPEDQFDETMEILSDTLGLDLSDITMEGINIISSEDKNDEKEDNILPGLDWSF